jgi:hypothetical protein
MFPQAFLEQMVLPPIRNRCLIPKRAARPLGILAIALCALLALREALPSFAGPEIANQRSSGVAGASQGQACEALLGTPAVAKVVLGRPAMNQLLVDEQAWFALPENGRRLLVSTARCAALAHGIDYGVVYSSRTRRRLALANADSVILD